MLQLIQIENYLYKTQKSETIHFYINGLCSENHLPTQQTRGALGFWVPENVTFQESSSNIEKRVTRRNQHKEPIEGIKVWLLLRYPSNILGYPSKYWNYTSKTKLGWFPHSPPVNNFFNIHPTKNIIEHKRCRIRL